MDVLMLVVWLNSDLGWAEIDLTVSDCEAYALEEGRPAQDNRARIRILQMRVAEEFRALVWPDLAEVMTRWALDPRITEFLYEEYVGTEVRRVFDEAIPIILERMAVVTQRAYSDLAKNGLFGE